MGSNPVRSAQLLQLDGTDTGAPQEIIMHPVYHPGPTAVAGPRPAPVLRPFPTAPLAAHPSPAHPYPAQPFPAPYSAGPPSSAGQPFPAPPHVGAVPSGGSSRSRTLLVSVVAAAVLAAGGLGAYVLYSNPTSATAHPTTSAVAAPLSPTIISAAPAVAPATAGAPVPAVAPVPRAGSATGPPALP